MHSVIIPMLAQIALTLFVLPFIGILRVVDVAKDKSLAVRGALDSSVYSSRSTKFANNFNNQFQLPVLFYVGCIFAVMAQASGPVLIYSAWAFVGLRLVHTLIHVTHNIVRYRFVAFLAGIVALAVFLVSVFSQVLNSPLMMSA